MDIAEAPFKEGFQISLMQDAPGQNWYPISAVVSRKEMRNRVTFPAQPELEKVFASSLVALIRQIIEQFNGQYGLFANPSEVLNLPGLTLSQVRAIMTRDGGASRAQIWFDGVMGQAHGAFRSGYEGPLSTEMTTKQLFRDALEFVLLPTLNIAATNVAGFDRATVDPKALTDALGKIEDARERLLLQAELLKRELARVDSMSALLNAGDTPQGIAAEPDQQIFVAPPEKHKIPSF